MEPAKAQAGLDLHPSEGATLLFEPPSSPPTPSHHLAVMLHTGRQRMAELVPFLEKKKKKKGVKAHSDNPSKLHKGLFWATNKPCSKYPRPEAFTCSP